MIRLLITGIWICTVMAGAIYAGAAWKAGTPLVASNQPLEGLEHKKTRPISVPMIADGALQGYIMAQFVYTIDAKTAKKLAVPPDVFLLDEAFRAIYGDEKLDFRRLERFDLTTLTRSLHERVNGRLNADMIKDVLVQEFNYVSLADVQAQR
jgi:hypothetical protein